MGNKAGPTKIADADNRSLNSLSSWDDNSVSSNESNESNSSSGSNISTKKNRYHFDDNMYDNLDRIIIIKVYSHQLNADFTIKTLNKHPKPNLFVVSANQFADNAATQARLISRTLANNIDKMSYLPFSPYAGVFPLKVY